MKKLVARSYTGADRRLKYPGGKGKKFSLLNKSGDKPDRI